MGRRDYAIVMLLVRLGFRRGEVAALSLDDIDWQAGELVVRGKGRRADRLPPPDDVGQAIAGWLRRGRPASSHREVFLRDRAPVAPIAAGTVASTVRRACRRCVCRKFIRAGERRVIRRTRFWASSPCTARERPRRRGRRGMMGDAAGQST
ncbi:MAG TPA: tyrosine-type recombinase/integrase [Trebonia sp.]